MEVNKKQLVKLIEESIKEVEIQAMCDLVLEELKPEIRKVVEEKYVPSKNKSLVLEHFIDTVLTNDLHVSYDSTFNDFKKVIADIDKMKDTHVPKQMYYKSLVKWFRDKSDLTIEEKKKLHEMISKKLQT